PDADRPFIDPLGRIHLPTRRRDDPFMSQTPPGAKIAKDFSDFTQTRRGMALELAIQNQDRIAATAEMYVGGAAIGTGVMAPAGVYLVGHGSDALRAANMRRRYPRSDLGNTVVFLGFRNGFELGGMSRESAAEAAATLEQGMSMAA